MQLVFAPECLQSEHSIGKNEGQDQRGNHHPEPPVLKFPHKRHYKKCHNVKKEEVECYNDHMCKEKRFPRYRSHVDQGGKEGDEMQGEPCHPMNEKGSKADFFKWSGEQRRYI